MVRYYARTQGTKASGLWEVFSHEGGDQITTIRKDLDLRQASELVWRLMMDKQ